MCPQGLMGPILITQLGVALPSGLPANAAGNLVSIFEVGALPTATHGYPRIPTGVSGALDHFTNHCVATRR